MDDYRENRAYYDARAVNNPTFDVHIPHLPGSEQSVNDCLMPS